jgi:adenylylsulfate kinase
VSAPTSGLVVWFTGYPASGKSTLARVVADALRTTGEAVCVLDGDDVRATLHPTPGYDDRARADFYASLAGLAALLAKQGLVVLVPATAHRASFRDTARALAPQFVEVFVDTPLAECQRRDPKGLYQQAPSALPGSGMTYEPPQHPDLTVLPGEPAAERLVTLIRSRLGKTHRETGSKPTPPAT